MTDPNAVITAIARIYTPGLFGMVGQVGVASLWREVSPLFGRWRTFPVTRGTWQPNQPPRPVETK